MIKYTEKLRDQIEEYFKSLIKIKFNYETNQFEVYPMTLESNLNKKLGWICAWFITKLSTLKNKNKEALFIREIGSFIEKSLNEYYKYPEYRLGQAFFNTLALSTDFKKYVEELTACEADCFYDDDKISLFLDKLWENINEV